MTITERLEKQRQFRMRQYAERIVNDKTGLMMQVYKLRASQFGEKWKMDIWKLCKEVKNDNKKN